MLAARGVGECHFSFYKVPCLRPTQCCLSCCTITIIGGGQTMKIACENNQGCQGSMTLLCPDSSWQRSGRVDKISTRRTEFLKDCSHAAMLQNKEKGETGDNGRIVSAHICLSFPWGSSSSLSLVFHCESGHFTLFVHPFPSKARWCARSRSKPLSALPAFTVCQLAGAEAEPSQKKAGPLLALLRVGGKGGTLLSSGLQQNIIALQRTNRGTEERGRQEVKGRTETMLFSKSQILNRTTWAEFRIEMSGARTPQIHS